MDRLKDILQNIALDKMKISKDILVLYVIYKSTKDGSRTWISDILNTIGGKLTKNDVIYAIDNLSMWGIIHGEYGDTGEGHSCVLYNIESCHMQKVAAMVSGIDNVAKSLK